MKNQIDNKFTDWLKAYSYILFFLLVFCLTTNKDWFFPLSFIFFSVCMVSYLSCELINFILKKI